MINQNKNLYWNVYKNLEKEFLNLANYIHLTDNQLGVYSMHIANLIIRCAIEIESISKELYYMNGGNRELYNDEGKIRDLYFDTDCLNLLEKKWNISKKIIIVSGIDFYFKDEKHKILTPLKKSNKRGTSGSKWKRIYQEIKHNRAESLEKATIGILLNILGALYILNVYYKNQKLEISYTDSFDNSFGSDIFSVFCYDATKISLSRNMGDISINTVNGNLDLEQSIYVKKYSDKEFKELHKQFCEIENTIQQRFSDSYDICKFLKENPEYDKKNIGEICLKVGGVELFKKIVEAGINFDWLKTGNSKIDIVLNKNNSVYPNLKDGESNRKNEFLMSII